MSVHVLELGGNWKDLFFFGSFHVLYAGFFLLSWLMLGFFSKHPCQCCVWKQVSSVIRSGVFILKHIFCVSGLSFDISDGMVSLGSIPLGEGFGSFKDGSPCWWVSFGMPV